MGKFSIALALCLISATAVYGQDAKQFVSQAVQTELNEDRNDHTHWLYFETDRQPGKSVKQWVAQAQGGDLQNVVELNGQKTPPAEQRSKMDAFVHDGDARSKQRKSEQHDDKQAEEMLKILPQAFLWSNAGTRGGSTVFHFKPDPQFDPPDIEAKVFAAMEGDMAIDTAQHRIVSLKGKMIHDVTILGGLLGRLDSGGTFDIERRETGKSLWQITETHVHIQGHALLFKNISEQEDDVKSAFKQIPVETTLEAAETELVKLAK